MEFPGESFSVDAGDELAALFQSPLSGVVAPALQLARRLRTWCLGGKGLRGTPRWMQLQPDSEGVS